MRIHSRIDETRRFLAERVVAICGAFLRRLRSAVEELDGGRCRLRTQGDSLEWLAFMLMWLGADFEVQEPPELVDYLGEIADRLTRSVPVRDP